MKFKELANMWFDIYSIGICYSHYQVLERNIRHLNDFIGDDYISDIKPMHINKVISVYAKENPHTKKPTSKRLLRSIVQTAYLIFEFAIDNDLLTKNPAKNIRIPKNAPVTKRNTLTDKEQALILGTQHRCQVTAMIMLLCGLRKSEVIALRWEDIDFVNKTINVNKNARLIDSNTYEVKQGTKNGKGRIVPFPNLLNDVLSVQKEQSRSKYLTYQTDGTMHSPTSFAQMWKSYETTLNYNANGDLSRNYFNPKGVPKVLQHITPHMLRHTYATLLYTSGVDVLTASKLLGHSNVEVTLGIYTHLQEERAKLSIDSFNNFVENNFKVSNDIFVL